MKTNKTRQSSRKQTLAATQLYGLIGIVNQFDRNINRFRVSLERFEKKLAGVEGARRSSTRKGVLRAGRAHGKKGAARVSHVRAA